MIPYRNGKSCHTRSEPYTEINGNIPSFTDDEITDQPFETYSPLDTLGRCGMAFACVGQELMPTEDRGSIGQVKRAAGIWSNTTASTANICIIAVT